MKPILLFCLSFLTVSASFSQNGNVVLFTENGERFHLILNGARQNDQPETQVKVTGLNAEWYKSKIIFDDPALGTMDKNLSVPFGHETAYSIKLNKKGEYVYRLVSSTPLAQLPPPAPNQTVVVYNPNPAPVAQVTVTETTTTTVGTGTEQVNVGVNMPGINMNVNINDGMGGTVSQSSTTTTYSTTTSTTAQPAPQPVQPVYVMPGYNGPVGCPMPMSPTDFQSAKASIEKQSFSDTQLQIAKQIVNSNCLTSAQVKEIMMIFDFEDTRLDLAKYCYGYTFDLGNYYKVNDAFTFSTSVDELNSYINQR